MTQERDTPLTTKQLFAVDCLMRARTVQDAAVQAKVGRKTLYRWLELPVFVAALRETQRQATEQATRLLSDSASLAVTTLVTLCDKSEHDNVRASAANSILSRMLDLRAQSEFEARLVAVEERLRGTTGATGIG